MSERTYELTEDQSNSAKSLMMLYWLSLTSIFISMSSASFIHRPFKLGEAFYDSFDRMPRVDYLIYLNNAPSKKQVHQENSMLLKNIWAQIFALNNSLRNFFNLNCPLNRDTSFKPLSNRGLRNHQGFCNAFLCFKKIKYFIHKLYYIVFYYKQHSFLL